MQITENMVPSGMRNRGENFTTETTSARQKEEVQTNLLTEEMGVYQQKHVEYR